MYIMPSFFKNIFIKLLARALGASLQVYLDSHFFLRIWDYESLKEVLRGLSVFTHSSYLSTPRITEYFGKHWIILFMSGACVADPALLLIPLWPGALHCSAPKFPHFWITNHEAPHPTLAIAANWLLVRCLDWWQWKALLREKAYLISAELWDLCVAQKTYYP